MRKKFKENLTDALMGFEKFTKENGYPPTCRELCTMMNYTSSSTGYRYLKGLIDAGYLEKKGRGNRNLKRTNKEFKPDSETESASGKFYRVPIVKDFDNGRPNFENIEYYITFFASSENKFNGRLFAVRSEEDIKGKDILKGDFIIAIDDGKNIITEINKNAVYGTVVGLQREFI